EAVDVLKRAIKIVPGHRPTLERLEWAFVDLADFETAVEYRGLRLRQTGYVTRADQLARDSRTTGAAEARRRDLRVELDQLLVEAADREPFADAPTTNSIGDRLALTYSQLGEWPEAVTWIERGFADRPGRLRRMLMDLPFDLRGLSSQPRFLRL